MAEGGQKGSDGGPNIDPKTASDIAKSMQSVKQSALEATNAFSEQIKILSQLQNSMQAMSSNMKGVCDASDKCFSPDKWKQVTKAASGTEKQFNRTQNATEKLAKSMKSDLAKALTVTSGVLDGLAQGFKNLVGVLKGVGGVISGVVGAIFSIGKAILSIPFKIWNSLVDMAASGGGGNELAQAYEKVREAFGSFSSVSSKAIISTAKSMRGFNDTGLNSVRIFGNLAERMEYMTELAKGMGAQFSKHAAEFERNGGALIAYQKGLGITAEQMNAIAGKADQMGVAVGDVLKDMTKQSLGLAKAFGLDAKVISREMGKAMADVKNFGHLTSQELATAVVYSNKLGVSIEKLTGLMDSFDTFDSAAENASKLNEQFGLNIDAQEIMSAQDPAKKMEILRKEFARTGKDMTKLTYQEKKLIQQSTGMDAAAVDAMLAQKDTADMYKKVAKESDKVAKSTMTQTEALKGLSDQIERMVKSGGEVKKGGFFANILEGFEQGIKMTPEFQGLLKNIRASMIEAQMFGRKLGKAFVDAFPGVKDMIVGLKDLLEPKKIRALFSDILKIFDDFKNGNIKTFDELMIKLKDTFFNWFDKSSGPGKKFLDGFVKFKDAFMSILGKALEWVFTKLAETVDGIVEWLKKPKIPPGVAGFADSLMTPMQRAFDALANKLMPALGRLAGVLWEKLKDALLNSKEGHTALVGAILMVIGPGITKGLVSAAAAGLFNGAGKAILAGLGKGAENASKGGNPICKQLADAQKQCKGKFPGGGTSPADAVATAIPSSQKTGDMERAASSKINWARLGQFLLGFTAVLAILFGAFMGAIAIASNFDTKTILSAVIIFGVIAAAMLPAALMLKVLSSMKKVDNAAINKALGSIALIMGGGLLMFLGAALIVAAMNIDVVTIGRTALVFMALVPVFAAAGVAILIAAGVAKLIKVVGGAELAKGLFTIGAVVLGMGVVAGIVGGIAKLVGPNEMLAGAQAMEAMGKVFVMAGIVIGIAMAVAFILASTSLIGGGAILLGVAAIGGVVVAMGAVVVCVMKKLSEIKEDPAAIKAKAEGFSAIMLAISDFASKIADILKAIPRVDNSSDQVKIVDSVSKLVADLVGKAPHGDDRGSGICGIIYTIVEGMKAIPVEKVPLLEAFASILAAVSTVVGSVTKGMVDYINVVVGAGPGHGHIDATRAKRAKQAIEDLSGNINETIRPFKGLIEAISKSIQEMNIAPGFEKNGAAIAGIFGSVASMVQTLMPDMSKFSTQLESTEDNFWHKGKQQKKTEMDTGAIHALQDYVVAVLGKLTAFLPNLTELIVKIADSVKVLSPQQIAALGPLAEIVKGVAAFAQVIATISTGQNKATVDLKDSKAVVVNVVNQAPDIVGMLDMMKDTFPDMVKKIIAITSTMPSGMKKKAEDLAAVFGVVQKIGEMSKAFIEGIPVKEGDTRGRVNIFREEIWSPLLGILAMLAAIDEGGWNGDYSFKKFASYTKEIGDQMGRVPNMVKTSDNLVKFFENIGKMIAGLNAARAGLPPGSQRGALRTFLEDNVGPVLGVLAALASMDKSGWGADYAIWRFTDYMLEIQKDLRGNLPMMTKLSDDLAKFFEAAGRLIAGIMSAFSSFGSNSSGTSVFETFKGGYISLIKAFAFMAGDDGSGTSGGEGEKYKIKNLVDSLRIIREAAQTHQPVGKKLMNMLTEATEVATAISTLTTPAENIDQKIGYLENLPKNVTAVGVMMEKLQMSFAKISGEDPGAMLSSMTPGVPKGEGMKGQARAVIDAVKQMVEAVVALDAELEKGSNINIKTRLEKFASSMGLGSTGIYSVAARDVVLNVNLTVTMNANTVEEIILKDKNSIIRDRLNYLMDGARESFPQNMKDEATKPVGSIGSDGNSIAFPNHNMP